MTPGSDAPSRAHRLLADARLYLCVDARRTIGDFTAFVDEVYGAGVDIVQLRDKTLTAAEEVELLRVLGKVAAAHGKLWAVNDRADIAAAVAAPVLHLGQDDLSPLDARKIVGPEVAIGRSSHSVAQFTTALTDETVDYVCAGPVWQTPTKPGRAATGLGLIRQASTAAAAELAAAAGKPWFAIGGVDTGTIRQVLEAGASRVVVVRAITDAARPVEVTVALREALGMLAG